jgi:hypothetical protein
MKTRIYLEAMKSTGVLSLIFIKPKLRIYIGLTSIEVFMRLGLLKL